MKKLQKTSFKQIIIGIFISKYINPILKRVIRSANKSDQIGDYKLISYINKTGSVQKYTTGIYLYKDNKVLIKSWSGVLKDYHYYSLINEYITSKIIRKKLNSLSDSGNIAIPQILDYIENERTLSIVYEFVEGKNLINGSDKELMDSVSKTLNSLSKATSLLTNTEQKMFLRRDRLFYLLTLPFFVFLLVIQEPQEYKIILKSLFKSLSLKTFLQKQELILTHRDLQPENFIVKGKKTYLLDYEHIALTTPGYDLAYLLTEGFDKNLGINLEIDKPNLFLMIYIVMQQASGWNISRSDRLKYIRVLSQLSKRNSINFQFNNLQKSMSKRTLSIGIPVYNESKNIEVLLKSIERQKSESFLIKKIIIISDGSTDATGDIVKSIARKDRRILFINDTNRKGKTARINEIMTLNQSEFILLLDGDILLGNNNVIENLIKCFVYEDTVIVAGNITPVSSENFIGLLINTWEQIWHEVKKDINGSNTIYNVRGGVCVLRKSFTKNIWIPSYVTSATKYLYLIALKQGKKFAYEDKSFVLYRLPDNLKDYLSFIHHPDEKLELAKLFGENTYQEYKTPLVSKISGIIKVFLSKPIITIATLIFVAIINFLPYKNGEEKQGFWEIVQSTKKEIKLPV